MYHRDCKKIGNSIDQENWELKKELGSNFAWNATGPHSTNYYYGISGDYGALFAQIISIISELLQSVKQNNIINHSHRQSQFFVRCLTKLVSFCREIARELCENCRNIYVLY